MEISKISEQIFVGTYKHPLRNTKEFQELEIDIIINCAKEVIYRPDSKYLYYYYPIDDGIDGSILELKDDIADQINYFINQNKKIYIHCVHGKSRSPIIIIYYLMKYYYLTFDEAYQKIKNIRTIISINDNFIKELTGMKN